MKLVHSYLTQQKINGNWPDTASFFRSFALSFLLARKHFDRVELVTDSLGSYLLKDLLGLQYQGIDKELENMKGRYPDSYWAAGKVRAYQIQNQPFCHIDGDVYLIKPPKHVFNAPVVFQGPEDADMHKGAYKLQSFKNNFPDIPESWKWCFNSTGKKQYAVNMGLYACNNLTINRRYCKEYFDFLESQGNREVYSASGFNDWGLNISLEQFTASAVCRMFGIQPKYIVDRYWWPVDWSMDYVHLVWLYKGEAEHNNRVLEMLKAIAPKYISRADLAAEALEKEFSK